MIRLEFHPKKIIIKKNIPTHLCVNYDTTPYVRVVLFKMQ